MIETDEPPGMAIERCYGACWRRYRVEEDGYVRLDLGCVKWTLKSLAPCRLYEEGIA